MEFVPFIGPHPPCLHPLSICAQKYQRQPYNAPRDASLYPSSKWNDPPVINNQNIITHPLIINQSGKPSKFRFQEPLVAAALCMYAIGDFYPLVKYLGTVLLFNRL